MEATEIKARACTALLLAILCCGCEQSSHSPSKGPAATDPAATDPATTGSGGQQPTKPVDDPVWTQSATRVEETDLATVFSDGWVHANTAHGWSGGQAASAVSAGATLDFSFIGTRIRWIGWQESSAGIARVYVDGVLAGQVDLYSNTIALKVPVFTSEELEQGPHTFRIEVTGTRNAAASGTMVVVDALEIVSSVPPPSVTRIEETASSLSFTGEWFEDPTCACSAGRSVHASGPDALVSFSFTGTRVRWIGWRKDAAGIARIYLDGALAGEVDLYSTTFSPQAPVFTSEILAHGPHTLLIEVTGTGNPAATETFVVVDAFDVAGPMSP